MKLNETTITDNRLRKLLHTKFGGPDQTRSPKVVHVSMLTDATWQREYCPRESALAYLHAIEGQVRWISTAERLTYDVGNFYHDIVVRKLTAEAIGDWECSRCGWEKRGTYQDCENCKFSMTYKEMFFRSPITGVVGSIDLVLNLGFSKAVIVEIKSVEKDKFRELALPMAEHRQRVLGYLQLLREVSETNEWVKENISLNFGYVLYVSKGLGHYFKKKGMGGIKERYSPFQEFVVRPNGGAQKHVDEMFARAKSYWKWRAQMDMPLAKKGAKLPARIKNCSNSQCKRAIKCNARKECWGD